MLYSKTTLGDIVTTLNDGSACMLRPTSQSVKQPIKRVRREIVASLARKSRLFASTRKAVGHTCTEKVRQ